MCNYGQFVLLYGRNQHCKAIFLRLQFVALRWCVGFCYTTTQVQSDHCQTEQLVFSLWLLPGCLQHVLEPCWTGHFQVLSPVGLLARSPHFIFLHQTFWTSLSISIPRSLWSLWICFHLGCCGIDSLTFQVADLLVACCLNFLGVDLCYCRPSTHLLCFSPTLGEAPLTLPWLRSSGASRSGGGHQEVVSMATIAKHIGMPYLLNLPKPWGGYWGCLHVTGRGTGSLQTCQGLHLLTSAPLCCQTPLSAAFPTQKPREGPLGDQPLMLPGLCLHTCQSMTGHMVLKDSSIVASILNGGSRIKTWNL